MKARLIQIDSSFKLLLCNGRIKKIDLTEAREFLKSYNSDEHYNGPGKWDYEISMEDYSGKTLAVVDDTGILKIYDPEFICSLLTLPPVKYISCVEYAEKHGKQRGIVMRFCREGRIPGAFSVGSTWIIPEDAPYPSDARVGRRVKPSE